MPRPEPRECIEDGAENSFKECKLRVEAQKEEHEEEDDAPGQKGKCECEEVVGRLAHQNWGKGKCESASGYATNACPCV